ncbi:MAG: ThiF family adenylyltransferase [Thermoanaerobaculia bacterium]
MRLREDGYDISIQAGRLLLKGVPYVTTSREVKRGTLVSTLHLAGDATLAPDTHVVLFAGDLPCRSDGTALSQIINASNREVLGDGLTIDFSFSSKPPGGKYADYHEKMTTYVRILEHEAHAIDPTISARTFPVILPEEEHPIFRYEDTASSRANIGALNDKLRTQSIAIIGLGGTGSYILDLVAKTPVNAIELYDGDHFGQHNAFRSPGAATIASMAGGPNKAEYFREQYDHMHARITAHPYYITQENIEELRTATVAFICVDRNSARKLISEHLEGYGIPFIDVGMGVPRSEGALTGILRVTTSTPDKRDHVPACVSLADADAENEYERNIQIADLNALNAALAVIKWKKLCGIYDDTRHEHHSTYTIRANMLLNEEEA